MDILRLEVAMRRSLIPILSSLLLVPLLAGADIPSFTAEGILYCDGVKLNVGSYAAPLAVDWDGDGRKDLICGQYENGQIRFYPNVGTNDAPVFDSWSYLMDGAQPISVPYG